MITKNGQVLAMESIDVKNNTLRALPICKNEIPGTALYHITVPAGEKFCLERDEAHYNIFILIEGKCKMISGESCANWSV